MRRLDVEALESKNLLTAYLVEDINMSPDLTSYVATQVGDELYWATS